MRFNGNVIDMRRKIRVLLIAEAANPEWASVPLEGWSLSRALAKLTDAHLITHVRNRAAIIRAGLTEGKDFSTIDNEKVAAPLYRLSELLRGGTGKGWTTITAFSALSYYAFEWEFWRQFGSRIRAGEFDLVHRITPISPTHQSLIAKPLKKYRVPFVIGPLNGGVPWPKHFVDRQHVEREWLSHIRGLYRLMPGYTATRRYSSAIIAGSKYTYSELPSWTKDKCVYIPENGFDADRFSLQRTRAASLPLKIAFVGRLVPYKGADILLDAAADFLKSGQLTVTIIGDGPQRSYLESMVRRLDIEQSVQFKGWLPHVEIQNQLRLCDALILPSIREFGGAVVVEAMALGVAPIVADYGGPSELVTDTTGIRVGFSDRQSLVTGIKRAIADVIRCPKQLDQLGAAAQANAQHNFTWDAKARQVIAVYDAVLNGEPNLNHLDFQ
jgi:glycosyltransferase involved in cell wall biosynthesis